MNKGQEKAQRLRYALSHREGDRVPVGEFFWTGFVRRCKKKWGPDFDPYRHFDLDYVIVTPNMDPQIRPFEVIKRSGDDIVVKTGFGATIRRSGDAPMPYFESFSVRRPEEMADFDFDGPADPRRFFQGGDDQINCLGDTLLRHIPSWEERLISYVDDFAVFGSVCEPYEYLWRIIGSENALIWMVTDTDLFADFVNRIGEFLAGFAKAQINAGRDRLSGMYIWGDVAYHKGLLFGVQRWRELLKPHVKALVELCHSRGLMVVYHGCGNSKDIFNHLVEIGVDAFNPVETKAGLDVVELKNKYAGKMAFIGNVDIRVLESGDSVAITNEVLHKLRAAKGGGWVFQSDHSISSAVSPESYTLALDTVRKFGVFPLHL